MAVTSQIVHHPGFGEVIIHEWREAGLLKESVIKPVIFTAEKRIVLRRLGQLKERDQLAVRQVIGELIG